jgi:hypothetical protein
MTDWFDGSVVPVRDGVYERLLLGGKIVYSKFKNGHWRAYDGTIHLAEKQAIRSNWQQLPWRGITIDEGRRPGLLDIAVRIAERNPRRAMHLVLAQAKTKWHNQKARRQS